MVISGNIELLKISAYGHVYGHGEDMNTGGGKLSTLFEKLFSEIRCFSLIVFTAQF